MTYSNRHRAAAMSRSREARRVGLHPASAAATVRLTPKETAVHIRKALRAAFPGTKFSLTNSTGTGYGYMHLTWTDGPTSAAVEPVVQPFYSERSSDQPDDSVVHLSNGFTCKGVLTFRRYSPEAQAWADAQVDGEDECGTLAHRLLAPLDLTTGVPA